MAIQIKYRISYADYVECQRYRRSTDNGRLSFWLRRKIFRTAVIVLMCLGGATFLATMSIYVYRVFAAGSYGIGFLSVSLIAAILLSYYYPRREKQKELESWPTFIMEIDDEKIMMGEEPSQKRRLWGYFLNFAETKNLFLLAMDNDRMLLIPKRSFASIEECGAFAALARSKVGIEQVDEVEPDNLTPETESI